MIHLVYGFALEIIGQTRQEILYNLRLKKLTPYIYGSISYIGKTSRYSRMCADKLESDYGVVSPVWQHALAACISKYRD